MVTVHWLFCILADILLFMWQGNGSSLWPADSHYMHTKVLQRVQNANKKHANTVLVLSVLSQSCQAIIDSFRTGDWQQVCACALKMKWPQWICRCSSFSLSIFSNGICTYSMLQQSAVVLYCHWFNQSAGNFIVWYSLGILRFCVFLWGSNILTRKVKPEIINIVDVG